MKAKIAARREAGDDAELLAGHGEDEIGVRVGQNALDRAFARPLAEPAAGDESSRAPYRPGTCRRTPATGARIEELHDARADMRHEFIGEQRAAEPPTPPRPTTQNQCSPAMKNSAAQTSEISMVWPKSGCSISGTIVSGSSSRASRLPGTSLRLRAFRKGPGGENDEGGLQEFRRLNAENPAPRALDLLAEEQRRDDKRHATRRRRAAPRGAHAAARGRTSPIISDQRRDADRAPAD